MQIRQLNEANRDPAIRIWEEVGLVRSWNDPAADYDRALRGATSAVLGAFDGDELVATVMVGHDGHRGWVYYLAVEPARRRRGLALGMMQAAEGWLRDHGAVKLNLMVRHDNSDASAFYRRLGYEDAPVTVLARWLV